jgi:hypothetical protein
MLTATATDRHVEQLFDRMRQLHAVFTAAGVPYRLVGGLAVHLHVAQQDPLQARLTADIDAGVERQDLPRIVEAAAAAGWEYRHTAGVDMLVDARAPRARSPVRLIFLREKVRPDYLEPVPDSAPVVTAEGILLAPVSDLVRMKLTSYRLKDRVHIQDMDNAGLITPAIEAGLPAQFRRRLAEIRATE